MMCDSSLFVFFFKQKTAYEMRISDWSSDVCSSDLSSVLSGNRNFEGRVHSEVKMNYLASPPLVVAYALAGTIDIDMDKDSLGSGSDGQPVYLKDIWPSSKEISDTIIAASVPDMFKKTYASVLKGDSRWNKIASHAGEPFSWDADSLQKTESGVEKGCISQF